MFTASRYPSVLASACLLVGLAAGPYSMIGAQEDKGREEEAGLVRARTAWFLDRRKGPDGTIPFAARARALEQLERSLREGLLVSPTAAVPGDLWESLGPEELLYNTSVYSGRVTALALHPSDPDILYAGTAQGGVWKTADGGLSWAPLTDGEKSLATGSIAIDPSDPNRLFVGTGEPYEGCGAYYGAGILRSENAGASWTLLGEPLFSGTSVSRIVIHPSNPQILWASNAQGWAGFVCTAPPGSQVYGVRKSLDGGASWSLVLGAAQTGLPTHTYDLVMEPSNPDVLYAAVGGSGVWKTTNGGTSWTKLAGGLPVSDIGRVDLAIKPSDDRVLYATFERASLNRHLGTWRSADRGATWTALPPVPSGGTCMGYTLVDICTYESLALGLCNYAMYVEVAPDDTVWLGGVGLWKSTSEGSSWIAACPQTLHVDQHAAVFGPGGRVWAGNDGGVFWSEDGGVTWNDRNRGLRTAQFYPGASLHPTNAAFALGGTQDNGTFRYSGSASWSQVYTGDGAFSAVDFTDPDNVWYVSAQYLNVYKTVDGGATVLPAMTGLTDAGTIYAPFIAPIAMCPSNASVLLAGSDNVWKTTNGAASWSSNSPDPLAGLFQTIRAIAFAPSDASCNTVFVGMANGRIYRTLVGGGQTGWNNVTGSLPAAGVSDIAVDPTDGNIVYVARSGFGVQHVYKSTNALSGAVVWTPISAGLPDTPVDSILIDPDDRNVLYIGTDIGIFRSTDAGASWGSFMEGHPRVGVYDLVGNAATGSILSFTHGRGAFRLGTACTAPDFGGVDSAGDPSACATGGLLVTWSPPASWGQGAGGGTYDVRRFESPACDGTSTLVASGLPAATTSFTDTTAAPGVTYHYRVIATNDCATPRSSSGTASCSGAASDAGDSTPCGGVGPTLRVARGAADALLTWTAVGCADLASYEVYGSTAYDATFPGGWTLLGSPVAASFEDPLDSPWTAYRTVTLDSCGNRSAD